MFTFGFYNAMNHDRKYNAEEVSSMFDGIILDGIYMHVGNRFMVKAQEDLDDTVIIGSGRAWFNHTWSLNDSDLAMKGPRSDVVRDRIDAIVIDVDTRDKIRKNQLLWVTGEITGPTAGQRPTMIKEDGRYQYPICYIERKASSRAIRQANITNMVGTSSAPFVTGVLQGMDIDDLVAQWQDQWHQFVEIYQQETIEWRDQKKAEINAYITEWKAQMNEFTETEQKKFLDWMNAEKTEFVSWFETIVDILDEDAAGHLYLMITKSTETEFNHYYGLINSTTEINDQNGKITTTSNEGTISTVIGEEVNGVQTITTVVTPTDGSSKYTKTTVITATDSGSKISTTYTKALK